MRQDQRVKLALLGAAGGAAAGLAVVLFTWFFLPRSTEPAPSPPGTRASEDVAVASPSANVATPAGMTPTGPAAKVNVPPAARVRTEDQAEIYAKLKKIGLAMHTHNDKYRTFAPPMAAPGDDKATRLSWRVRCAPGRFVRR